MPASGEVKNGRDLESPNVGKVPFYERGPRNTTTRSNAFWGCNLSEKCPSVTWKPHFPGDPDDTGLSAMDTAHVLTIRQATLGLDAKENERNIIQVETKNVGQKSKIKMTIVSLKLNLMEQCQLKLDFKEETTFTMISGTGPVDLTGCHTTEFTDSDYDHCEEDTDEDEEDFSGYEDIDEEELEDEKEPPGKKSKAKVTSGQEKRNFSSLKKSQEMKEDEEDMEDGEYTPEGEEEESAEGLPPKKKQAVGSGKAVSKAAGGKMQVQKNAVKGKKK